MIDMSLSQLMDLAAERDRIEQKMGKLHLAARGLLNLVDNKAQREGYKAMLDNFRVRIGLTDLIRLCLTMSEKPMTAVEIRNFIRDFGSESSNQQNLLQSIHTIVKRMEGGLIKEEPNEDGEKAYSLMTIAERLVKTGVDKSSANKAGDQIENKFDLARVWAEALNQNTVVLDGVVTANRGPSDETRKMIVEAAFATPQQAEYDAMMRGIQGLTSAGKKDKK